MLIMRFSVVITTSLTEVIHNVNRKYHYFSTQWKLARQSKNIYCFLVGCGYFLVVQKSYVYVMFAKTFDRHFAKKNSIVVSFDQTSLCLLSFA